MGDFVEIFDAKKPHPGNCFTRQAEQDQSEQGPENRKKYISAELKDEFRHKCGGKINKLEEENSLRIRKLFPKRT